jgi:uncharacterized membrane protein
MVTSRTADLTAVGLVFAVLLAGVALWSALPAEMAIHFGASGEPDNFVSKPVGIFLTPAIGLGAVAFVRVSKRLDPTADERTLDLAVLFLGATSAYVHGFVLAWNLGYRVEPLAVVAPVVAGALLLSAYAAKRDGVLG